MKGFLHLCHEHSFTTIDMSSTSGVRFGHRVGVENEKFGFQLDTSKPMSMNHIGELLEGMASRFGFERITEGGTIAGLEKVHVSLEFVNDHLFVEL